mgnify:CR=1 FL=1
MLLPAAAFTPGAGVMNCTVGGSLPTPDVTGTIDMSGTNGKVALVSNQTALSGACPTANVIDEVGYGTNPYRRYLGVMVKKPLGDAFDKGLAALKTKAEARAVATPSRI